VKPPLTPHCRIADQVVVPDNTVLIDAVGVILAIPQDDYSPARAVVGRLAAGQRTGASLPGRAPAKAVQAGASTPAAARSRTGMARRRRMGALLGLV
jgi:hypothetical protein